MTFNHADDIKQAFGKRIRELRTLRGFSQEELASMSGLDRTYIGGVERGERNISLINIYRIAAALEVETSALFVSFFPMDKTTQ
jgi:transcriptional regulator with XRE-family HTH domain